MDKKQPIIISLGGSLIVPDGGIDIDYLIKFNRFIREKVAEGWRFFIIAGGGKIARHYIDAGKRIIGEVSDWDLDWLGIHSTRLNAHLIRTIFQDIAHARIIENYEKKIARLTRPVVVAAGWKPGCSTDFDAVKIAKDYGVKILINMSNITQVYDKDPKKYKNAKPLHKINWREFKKIVGDKWSPGINLPFDPKATIEAEKLKLLVYVIGKDFANFEKILKGQNFFGTIIHP